MNTLLKCTVLLTLCLGTAYGQVPASNDTSDDNFNTGVGTHALNGPVADNSGLSNTAIGSNTLFDNTTGSFNTAVGSSALFLNSTGNYNTASGFEALRSNTTGGENTASGFEALLFSTTGGDNTASGTYALFSNTTGNNNTASGAYALQSNTTANGNTASGYQALYSNSTGYQNTATGLSALYSNTIGTYNTAFGNGALLSNTTASDNTAFGTSALPYDPTGSNNIAVGFQAGLNVKTGSDDIEIGNEGAAADNKVIKIGTEGTQKKTYIAGIYGNTAVNGLAVVIGSNGELGAVSSSERFKTGIAPMGSNTEKLQQLRPVTFHYKADAQGTLRYGLIAEEVAKVYPELVVVDQNGRIDGIRYDELAPMLLNEMQKEHATVADQAAEIRDLRRQVAKANDLERELAEMHAALTALQSTRDQLVAQR
jgi:Chaperone of endosialidase